MEVKKCPKGHYYDAGSLTECPVCAAENQAAMAVPLPPAELKVCPNGHYYNPEIYDKCPECSSQMPKTVILNLDRLDTEAGFGENYMTFPESSGKTVLFCAYEDMRFRLWIEGNQHKAQFHWLVQPNGGGKALVFEKETELSEHDFEAAVNQVIKIVYKEKLEQLLPETGTQEPNSRLMLDTWLIRWDHSWYDKYIENTQVRYICRVLKETLARVEKVQSITPWGPTLPIQTHYLDMRYDNDLLHNRRTIRAIVTPWGKGVLAEMELEEHLEEDLSLKMKKRVFIPTDQWTLMEDIRNSGIMEVLLKSAQIAPKIVVGSNNPTIQFSYHWGSLEFRYDGVFYVEDYEGQYIAARAANALVKWMAKYEQETVPTAPQNHWYTLP